MGGGLFPCVGKRVREVRMTVEGLMHSNKRRMAGVALVTAVLGVASVGSAAEPEPASALVCGVGQSGLTEARAAGAEAAQAAKAALGGEPPKVVVVFAARRLVGPALVEGLATCFEKSLIYGCEGYAPLTAAGNGAEQPHTATDGVAVLALGGAVDVVAAAEPVPAAEGKAGFTACGRKLGEQLAAKAGPAAVGRLVLTFGNQHVGDNQPFVEGLQQALGTNTIIVGAAAGGREAQEIVRGEIVKEVNVALLLAGSFRVGVGMDGGGGDLVAKPAAALKAAVGGAAEPRLVLVFDCGGRRGELIKQQKLAAEFAQIKALVPRAPLFGFYGGGEIGTTVVGAPARGVGFSVAVATIY